MQEEENHVFSDNWINYTIVDLLLKKNIHYRVRKCTVHTTCSFCQELSQTTNLGYS